MLKSFFNKSEIAKEINRLDKKICCTQACEICSFIDSLEQRFDSTIPLAGDLYIVKDSEGDCWKVNPPTPCDIIQGLDNLGQGINFNDDLIPITNPGGCSLKNALDLSICSQLGNYDAAESNILPTDEVVVINRTGETNTCSLKFIPPFYIEVTYTEAQALVAGEGLIPGAMYKITDRGDRGIFLDAVSTTQFNIEGVRLMLIPSLAYSSPFILYQILGSYTIDTYVVSRGLVYKNLTGLNNGLPQDFPLDWELISKDTFAAGEYVEQSFGIIYDFENDWIAKQWDKHGNEFGIPYYKYTSSFFNPYSSNPVDITDWQLGNFPSSNHTIFVNNKAEAFFDNYPSGDDFIIHDNTIINAGIIGNATQRVARNFMMAEDTGGLSYNIVPWILDNTTKLRITNNVAQSITFNYNNYGIDNCNISGTIDENGNNGD